jgi:hypothetical protein
LDCANDVNGIVERFEGGAQVLVVCTLTEIENFLAHSRGDRARWDGADLQPRF